jgi:hypothetical protein
MNLLKKISIRVLEQNPDHHLWNNHGTWWCHYTVHLPNYTKHRVRLSLQTSDVREARRLRDRLLRRKTMEENRFYSSSTCFTEI